MRDTKITKEVTPIVSEIKMLIEESKQQLAVSVNALMTRLYERTALSKKPEETIRNDLSLLKQEQKISPDLIFRDPYFLDFWGLKDTYSEQDLESDSAAAETLTARKIT